MTDKKSTDNVPPSLGDVPPTEVDSSEGDLQPTVERVQESSVRNWLFALLTILGLVITVWVLNALMRAR